MDTAFQFAAIEKRVADLWEDKKIFVAHVNPKKKPFSIVLPPPNANGFLHMGHAMFTYEDILIRYHKLIGDETIWVLGLDHAGFETQYVFEKFLRKQGKSRFDYDRDTLYQMIWDFVMENKGNIKGQLRRLGFGLDWSKETFTMDPHIVDIVHDTFIKLYDAGLIYRASRLVNYCTRDGTSFSDLEVKHIEQKDPLYYLKYGPFVLATVRPETKFGDTAVAVHPSDKRYAKWIGKEVEAEGLLGTFKLKVIADAAVDPKFGTGVVKVTPAHDFNDFEMGKRHQLSMVQVIGFDGKLNGKAGPYEGLKVKEARQKVVEALKAKGLIEKIDENYTHTVATCYKCGNVLEPLPLEQWYIKTRPLADSAKQLVENGEIRIYPKRFQRILTRILDDFIDWNISRQIVWGIRIPAYFSPAQKKWVVAKDHPGGDFVQDADTLDTWFSSSQWPFATLQMLSTASEEKQLYDYFYPTTVMETGHDILRAWIARMIMVGYFVTKKVPFQTVLLHGMVRDKSGAKMSKSKGNVIDPMGMVNKYGADALRAALIFGTKEGGDVALSEQKVLGMRNFANKLWNIGRLINLNQNSGKTREKTAHSVVAELRKEMQMTEKKYRTFMNRMQFSKALDLIYHFIWHRFADYYIEQLKEPMRNGTIEVLDAVVDAYESNLKMVHPFMPFVSEGIWQAMHEDGGSILEQSL